MESEPQQLQRPVAVGRHRGGVILGFATGIDTSVRFHLSWMQAAELLERLRTALAQREEPPGT